MNFYRKRIKILNYRLISTRIYYKRTLINFIRSQINKPSLQFIDILELKFSNLDNLNTFLYKEKNKIRDKFIYY